MKTKLFFSTLTMVAALAVAPAVFADKWTGAGDGTSWSDDDNWETAWEDGDRVTAEFGSNTENTTITVDEAVQAGTLYVYGDYTFDYTDEGALTIESSFHVDGSLTITGGKTTPEGTVGYIDGKLTLAGGTNHLEKTNVVEIATSADSSGTLEVTGGTNEFGNTYVGYNGTGTFTVAGGKNTFIAELWIGYNEGSSGTLEFTGGTTQSSNTLLWIGYNSTGTLKISDEASVEYDWTHIRVGYNGVGTIEITGGTKADFYHTDIYIGDPSGESKIAISGGTNNLFEDATIYIGYSAGAYTENNEETSGASGSFEITGGTNTFMRYNGNGTSIYVGSDDGHSGTFTISGGTTTFSAETTITIYDSGSLTIGGDAIVNLNAQIGTDATGTIVISDNAQIILGDIFLTGEEVVVLEAASITINGTTLSNEDSDAIATIIGSSISADGYDLTWTYDGNGTLSVVATQTVPEPSMFGLFFGLAALGLVGIRRRRR